jgi:sugar phosphate isomerase/epimerase
MGVKICVLGSGGSRAIPEGADPEEIWNKFTAIVAEVGRIAEKHGIRIAVEPLRHKETNLIHTVAEAMDVALRSRAENVGALVDFYHFHMNGEADDGLTPAGKRLFHAHIARPNEDRRMPMEEDIPTVDKWVAMLRDVDYCGNLSLEGKIDSSSLKETKAIVDRFR